MANAEIVVTRKHGNVFIGGNPLKINLTYDPTYVERVEAWFRIDEIIDTFILEAMYTFIVGMTWREWCDSDYNTDGYLCHTDSVVDIHGNYVEHSDYTCVFPNEEIIAGYIYVTRN